MSFLTDIFGGSKSKSQSGNLAYPFIQENYGQSGADAYNNALGGLGDVLQGGPQAFWDQGGGQFLLDQGLDGLTSKFSSMGLTRSGAAMKGMEQFRSGLASTYLDNWLNHMTDYGKLGLGAGGLVSGAGQYSKGKGSESSGGAGQFLGSLLAFASDRRLKTKIQLLHRDPDGLGWYRFAYKSSPDVMLEGVMADEVKELRPRAYLKGFVNGEYDGVNYAMLGA